MNRTFPSALTDAQWRLIEPMLSKTKSGTSKGGRPRSIDPRHLVNGILYLAPYGRSHRLPVADAPADVRPLARLLCHNIPMRQRL